MRQCVGLVLAAANLPDWCKFKRMILSLLMLLVFIAHLHTKYHGFFTRPLPSRTGKPLVDQFTAG